MPKPPNYRDPDESCMNCKYGESKCTPCTDMGYSPYCSLHDYLAKERSGYEVCDDWEAEE